MCPVSRELAALGMLHRRCPYRSGSRRCSWQGESKTHPVDSLMMIGLP